MTIRSPPPNMSMFGLYFRLVLNIVNDVIVDIRYYTCISLFKTSAIFVFVVKGIQFFAMDFGVDKQVPILIIDYSSIIVKAFF